MRGTCWIAGLLTIGWCLVVSADEPPLQLPGTGALTIEQPLDEAMVDGIDRYALKAIAKAREARAGRWTTNTESPEAYDESLKPYRERLRTILGVVDSRVAGRGLEDLSLTNPTGLDTPGTAVPSEDDDNAFYSVLPCRWQVLDGVTAEGIMLSPLADEIVGLVVCLPDSVWTPEEYVGADKERHRASPLPQWLAEQGFLVIVPTLISRETTFSGNPKIAMTNQSHREWVYRQAFELGRHVIGYEVQKVLAAIDAFERFNNELNSNLPIGVAGVGDGGMLALLAAAVDPRIEATLVSGYFQPREGVWKEPIDRNVWKLLTEFGDAEIAGMVAPRSLIIEACGVSRVETPAAVEEGRRAGAAPGLIETPALASVEEEFDRAKPIFEKLGASGELQLVVSGPDGTGMPGSPVAQRAFCTAMGVEPLEESVGTPLTIDLPVDSRDRQRRQVAELVEYTQDLLRLSAHVRDERWKDMPRANVDAWVAASPARRDWAWDEFIGKIPDERLPLNPRTRRVLTDEKYTGYEVVLDVFDDVIAAGILLVPTDLKPDEKRPVVVCQHGLEGVPMDTISGPGSSGYPYYKAFATELVKQGYVVYAPQNPYRGRDRFRTLQRKSNPLGRSLFSYILPQHQATLDWLKTLPGVDPQRIAFYGLSYGGKTAVRVPPLLTDYCLSICSADYDEWILKIATVNDRYSYMFTGEYEIFEWNMGNVANYAELSWLMTPRPFMVERGHDDGVAPDEWVAWEYAKVRRHYVKMGLGDKTEIEFFDGPHTINGQGTFQFLHKHLNWTPR